MLFRSSPVVGHQLQTGKERSDGVIEGGRDGVCSEGNGYQGARVSISRLGAPPHPPPARQLEGWVRGGGSKGSWWSIEGWIEGRGGEGWKDGWREGGRGGGGAEV